MSQPNNPNEQFRTRVLDENQPNQDNWNQGSQPYQQWDNQPQQPNQQWSNQPQQPNQQWNNQLPQQTNQQWSNQLPQSPAAQPQYQIPGANNELGFREEQNKLPKAIMIGVGVMLIGALVWGGLIYLIDRIFVMLAIGIGFGIAYALLMPFRRPISKKILLPLGVSAVILTIISVLLGNYIGWSLYLTKDLNISLGEALSVTREIFFEKELMGNHLMSALFALGGAIYGFFQVVRRG